MHLNGIISVLAVEIMLFYVLRFSVGEVFGAAPVICLLFVAGAGPLCGSFSRALVASSPCQNLPVHFL